MECCALRPAANARQWLTGAAYMDSSRLELVVPGIPDEIHACLFDLDGVPAKTAKAHADLAEPLGKR
jgi:hypothetical protein